MATSSLITGNKANTALTSWEQTVLCYVELPSTLLPVLVLKARKTMRGGGGDGRGEITRLAAAIAQCFISSIRERSCRQGG